MIYHVLENDHSQRIDKYIADQMDISRTTVTAMVKQGDVVVNDNIVKPSYLVSAGDVINVLKVPVNETFVLKSEKIDLDIVYEDDYLIVINKPSGLVVHPSPGHSSGTLVNALMGSEKSLSDINGEFRPGIIHRLDKDTSGLMVVAKDNQTHILMQDAMQERLIKRSYKALVEGVIVNNSGTIKAPVGRDNKDRIRQAVNVNGKDATTHFNVLKRFLNNTLVECNLETGRTHQIRVHMAYIGHPIVGDPLYNRKKTDTGRGQLLHAYKLSFKHPHTKETMVFEQPIPDNFQVFLDLLEGDNNENNG